jgi:hypothetical protein
MTQQFNRLSVASLKSYASLVNQFTTYCRSQGISTEPSEDLCTAIEIYLDLLGQTRNSQYVVSMRCAILDKYSSLGDFIEYDMDSKYLKGNPVKHFKIQEKVRSVKNTKIRDLGETQKKAYPVEYNDIAIILNRLKLNLHPFVYLQTRLLIQFCYYGMMRIKQVLDIKWSDLSLNYDYEIQQHYLEVKIRWTKTKDVNLIYRFYDLKNEDLLHCVASYQEYLAHNVFAQVGLNPNSEGFLFFSTDIRNGLIGYDLNIPVNAAAFILLLKVISY